MSQAARDAGLSKRQKDTALRVARIPEADFEALVESDNPPTVTRLAELGTRKRPPRVQPGPDGVACLTNDPIAAWPTFAAAVAARLEQGRHVYGDASFHREPAPLAGEVAEELLDVCAWSFILWYGRAHADAERRAALEESLLEAYADGDREQVSRLRSELEREVAA
jgi:hypothetical protein